MRVAGSTKPETLVSVALTVNSCWLRTYFRLKNFFRLARPSTAMLSRFGSIFRQMAAARAMTFTSVVKLSMTMSPW